MADTLTVIRKILGKAPPPPGRIPAMLAARRGMIDLSLSDLSPPATIPRSPAASLLVEQSQRLGATPQWSSDPADRVGYSLQNAEERFHRGEVAGQFGPLLDISRTPTASEVFGILAYPRGDRGTRRHELMHGYTEAALQGHSGMPTWARAAAGMPEWLRRPMDELGAWRAEGTSFQDIPWDEYAKRYAQQGNRGAAATARTLEAARQARIAGGDLVDLATGQPAMVGAAVGGLGLLGYGMLQKDPEEADREAAIAFLRENGQLPDPTAARPMR